LHGAGPVRLQVGKDRHVCVLAKVPASSGASSVRVALPMRAP
jgi:hypothetical protein